MPPSEFFSAITAGGRCASRRSIQQYVLTDGVRIVELHPAQGAAPPAMPSAAARSLAQTIQRGSRMWRQHVPVHGRVGTHDEFMKMVSAKTE
jgi:hypothetical protein